MAYFFSVEDDALIELKNVTRDFEVTIIRGDEVTITEGEDFSSNLR